jgi:hypothetical protein
MPVKQREQAAKQPVMTGREAADHLARAARIRGGTSPIYLLVQRTIKAIETEATRKGVQPQVHDPLYYDLKNAVSPLLRMMRRSQEEFDKRLLGLLEGAATVAVEEYKDQRRKARQMSLEEAPKARLKRKKV